MLPSPPTPCLQPLRLPPTLFPSLARSLSLSLAFSLRRGEHKLITTTIQSAASWGWTSQNRQPRGWPPSDCLYSCVETKLSTLSKGALVSSRLSAIDRRCTDAWLSSARAALCKGLVCSPASASDPWRSWWVAPFLHFESSGLICERTEPGLAPLDTIVSKRFHAFGCSNDPCLLGLPASTRGASVFSRRSDVSL